jgi:Glycosyl hydrolase family 48/Calx-beta domain
MSEIATFTVTLSSPSTSVCSAAYTTVDATAVAGTDYTLTAGTLTFAPGVTTGTVVVPVQADPAASVDKSFQVRLSSPSGCSLSAAVNTCVISTAGDLIPAYLSRFNWIYGQLKNTTNGYFGPAAGPKAFQMPYHAKETLIAEAPDWGHESVSETVSYWAKLEAWEIALNANTSGYVACWSSIENNYIPPANFQPWSAYTPASPATYTPDGDDPSVYPTLADATVTAGADPLATPLQTSYGTLAIYGMHWLWDVDGVFGFHNGDGTTVAVAVNNYSRGRHEGLFDTVMHVGWEDWTQGGNADGGFLPIYQQGLPTYPAAAFPYAKQFSYTTAPDAEVRAIGSAWLAHKFAAAQSLSVATQDAKAKKLGDYLRYCLYDKYFRAIPGYDGSGAHNLISWYSAFGGQIPQGGLPSNFGFRIGSSSAHFGYNGVDAAYAMGTTVGYSPTTAGAAAQWQNSLSRQLEMLRWLQSPEGPIAGGVTNSWRGIYATPTDGRQTAKFYGLYYDYSPVFSRPPSNNWVGYQGWGLERVAALYLATAGITDSFSVGIHANCGIILDKFVPWLLANITITAGVITMPTTLNWVSTTQVVGQTTTVPNLDGSYEFLPSLNWDSTGNYATFWSGSGSVPNPNLHCSIGSTGISVGIAASFAQLLIQYAHAKRTAGTALSTSIPNTSHTVMECYTLAKSLMDALWGLKDAVGITAPETRGDYSDFAKPTYIPPGFTGAMAHGETLAHGTTTFMSARSFLTSAPGWSSVAAYLAGGAAPVFSYHRFWEQTECAAGFAMVHQYFADLAE